MYLAKDAVSHSTQYKTEELASSILWNNGKSGMQLKSLPAIAQVAPVYAIATANFDKDGNTDILLAGNMLDVKPDIGRLDANDGIVLKGDGKGSFVPVPTTETRINVKGQVSDEEIIKTGNNKQALITARNNEKLMYFMLQ